MALYSGVEVLCIGIAIICIDVVVLFIGIAVDLLLARGEQVLFIPLVAIACLPLCEA